MKKALLLTIALVVVVAAVAMAQDGAAAPSQKSVITMIMQGIVTAAMHIGRSVVKWKQANPKSSFKSGEFWAWLIFMIGSSFEGYVAQ